MLALARHTKLAETMTAYTLVFTAPDGAQSQTLSDFHDDDTAIGDAKLVLSSDVVSVAIGRGVNLKQLDWLGAWDLDDGTPTWSPEE